MSSVITHSHVRRQLAAMACDYFDLGILRPDGRMLLREGWTVRCIEQAIQQLRRENARGAHIFVRPEGAHPLSLLDDLSADAIAGMKESGFQPALVIETSPYNFQAWLNHGRAVADHFVSTLAAKELTRRFGGDPSSADWRHFGRLAGFTNQKPGRKLESGLPPFVRLREYNGRVYGAAKEFLAHVAALAAKTRRERDTYGQSPSQLRDGSTRPLADFHADLRYAGDLHRADMAWAVHAASRGFSEQQIRYDILHARVLTKKGGASRQRDYADRTAIKAVNRVQSLR